jgi:hypothetical protein
MVWLPHWKREPIVNVSLDAAGLVALADLSTISQRTVLTGGASYTEALTLCPGIHRQYTANELNKGEYPACAALTTGYVFRVENPATVNFLQRSGRTGHLTTIIVERPALDGRSRLSRLFLSAKSIPRFLVLLTTLSTLLSLAFLLALQDYWAFCITCLLVVARVLSIFVVRRRVQRGGSWSGAKEPDVTSDLLVLASQDRWFRIKGLVNDVKAVTSGQWTADPTFAESCAISLATLLVYVTAALAANNTQAGNIILVALLLLNTGLLALANDKTKTLTMHGLQLRVQGEPKWYERRMALVHELIDETDRTDWAMAMGMLPPKKGSTAPRATM